MTEPDIDMPITAQAEWAEANHQRWGILKMEVGPDEAAIISYGWVSDGGAVLTPCERVGFRVFDVPPSPTRKELYRAWRQRKPRTH
jgi:hypothetical protein